MRNCIRNGVELYSGSRQLRRSLEQELHRLDPSQKYIITCFSNAISSIIYKINAVIDVLLLDGMYLRLFLSI